MPDTHPTTATTDALAELHRLEKAAADFFAARALAQNVYFTLQDALQRGQEFAGYNVNPLVPQSMVEELMTILVKAQAFYADLEANHFELLNWKPE